MTEVQERCTKQCVQNAKKSARSLSNQGATVQSIAKSAIPNGKIAVVKSSAADLTLQLKRAFDHRRTLKLDSNAVRLVNSRGDGLEGLIIDRFYRHVAVYILNARWQSQQKTISEALRENFDVDYLVFKDRTGCSTGSGSASAPPKAVEPIGQGKSQTIIEEHGLRFQVDLNDHLNAGLFLDMRKNRKLVAFYAKGRRVLNCFAYTCSFGVYCRKFGASRVSNVDISAKFLQKGKDNYRLNNLPEGPGEFVRDHAVLYLERAAKRKDVFDIIILDPPSFARYEGTVFSVKKDMPLLIDKALRALTPEGMLFISTNLSTIPRAKLEEWAHIAAKKMGRKIVEVNRLGQDLDFRESGAMKESFLSAILVKTTMKF